MVHTKPTISYAITVCNEVTEINQLLNFLVKHKHKDDEIVVLFDNNGQRQNIKDVLIAFTKEPGFKWIDSTFTKDFSKWKNELKSHCTGKWIFNIDADEMPQLSLMKHVRKLLNVLGLFDLIWVPRINTVTDYTQQDVDSFGWRIHKKGWINWPDYQCRLFKNKPHLTWQNTVHEVLVGAKFEAHLPAWTGAYFALTHPKDIQRQRAQNSFYDTLE